MKVTGGLARICMGGDPVNAANLRSIDRWGAAWWTTVEHAFSGASGMEYRATGAPDLSGVTCLGCMFHDSDGGISSWGVSGATDMSGMFEGAASFDQPLGSWDASSVTGTSCAFSNAASFNQPLDAWDV